jgi:hypothetical protein
MWRPQGPSPHPRLLQRSSSQTPSQRCCSGFGLLPSWSRLCFSSHKRSRSSSSSSARLVRSRRVAPLSLMTSLPCEMMTLRGKTTGETTRYSSSEQHRQAAGRVEQAQPPQVAKLHCHVAGHPTQEAAVRNRSRPARSLRRPPSRQRRLWALGNTVTETAARRLQYWTAPEHLRLSPARSTYLRLFSGRLRMAPSLTVAPEALAEALRRRHRNLCRQQHQQQLLLLLGAASRRSEERRGRHFFGRPCTLGGKTGRLVTSTATCSRAATPCACGGRGRGGGW